MAAVSFSIKPTQAIIAARGLDKNGTVQRYIDNEILTRCEPYVPRNTGALIASGWQNTHLGSGEVVYDTPYAAKMYYGKSDTGREYEYRGAPMRGAYWFERMKAANLYGILSGAAALAGARGADTPSVQGVKTVIGYRRNPVFFSSR